MRMTWRGPRPTRQPATRVELVPADPRDLELRRLRARVAELEAKLEDHELQKLCWGNG